MENVALGNVIVTKFLFCQKIGNAEDLEKLLRAAAEKVGATYLGNCFYDFKLQGATAMTILEESGYQVHSWPEDRIVNGIFYTCGQIDSKKAVEFIGQKLEAKSAWGSITYLDIQKIAKYELEIQGGIKWHIRQLD
jgi:S-adenosylmethionine/arginine decarboxylase-like enzyme